MAAGFNVSAYVTYFHTIATTQGFHPNIASWLVWSFVVVLNFTTYTKMTDDPVKSILAQVSGALTIVTMFVALYFGHLGALSPWEYGVMAGGILACVAWLLSSAANANLFIQAALAIGCVPTVAAVFLTPSIEPPQSWLLWAMGFALQGIVVWMRWNNKWQDAVYPINCVFWHGLVGLLALRA